MKKSKAQVGTFYVDCPYCGEGHVGEDGSYMLSVSINIDPDAPLKCAECGKEHELPQYLLKLL